MSTIIGMESINVSMYHHVEWQARPYAPHRLSTNGLTPSPLLLKMAGNGKDKSGVEINDGGAAIAIGKQIIFGDQQIPCRCAYRCPTRLQVDLVAEQGANRAQNLTLLRMQGKATNGNLSTRFRIDC